MLSTHVADALKKNCDNDRDADAMVLAKAAQNLGKDIFREKYTYVPRIHGGTLSDSHIPESLLALVTLVM